MEEVYKGSSDVSNENIKCDLSNSKDTYFFQHSNPVTGKLEWKVKEDDEHDYFTDIARSSYADMLHDKERNALYYKAIKLAVQKVHEQGKIAKVLDIGTGTGLLSMMAATAGAEIINAIEVFTPMAKVAKRIVKANGFSNINIINKHSTEVLLGVDIQERCNIIITELFDTELIGEGALNSYQHAHKNFMEEDCIAVPHKATVYVQVVQSEMMTNWNEMKPISINIEGLNEIVIEPDLHMSNGVGLSTVHDIQMTQLSSSDFKSLSDPIHVFEFDWSSKLLSTDSQVESVLVKSKDDGQAQIVLCWWDLEMFKETSIILSTAPKWLHPDPANMQWRDHWIQSIYFFPKTIKVEKNQEFFLKAFHDNYTMWFEICTKDQLQKENKVLLPVCTYPPRALLSRPRMGMINDSERNESITRSLFDVVNQLKLNLNSKALCISDFSLMSLFLAKSNFQGQIIALERSKIAQRGLLNLARHNNITSDRLSIIYAENVENFVDEVQDMKIQLLAGEPFFTSSYLPWHELYFWYARTELDQFLDDDAEILPRRANLWIVGLSFRDLWKIRAPVGEVEGFDVSLMDDMINSALEKKEHHICEPHHLWEYPNKLVTLPRKVMSFNFSKCVPNNDLVSEGSINFTKPSSSTSTINDFEANDCHAVGLWMEYELTENFNLSTGVQPPFGSDSFIQMPQAPVWSKHHKQAVFFFKHPVSLNQNEVLEESYSPCIHYNIKFTSESGEVTTKFDVN